MNIFLYIILFIIFSPKFFFLLAGKSTVSVTLGEILLNAFLFVLAVYVAEHLTHKYHILENYANKSSNKTSKKLTPQQIKEAAQRADKEKRLAEEAKIRAAKQKQAALDIEAKEKRIAAEKAKAEEDKIIAAKKKQDALDIEAKKRQAAANAKAAKKTK